MTATDAPAGEATPERALVVVAHPDDIDFGMAGTVATLTAAGTTVSYCLVTSGEAGGDDRTLARSSMAALRQAEQTAAAAEVGVHDLRFLGFPDGAVVANLDLRKAIARVIRQVRPNRLFTQSPERNYERIHASHPDHLAVGQAAMNAVYPDARNPFAFPELLDEGHGPWSVPEVWLAPPPGGPNRFVDITGQFDQKVAALLRHGSQIKHPDATREMMRTWAAANAEAAGLPEGRLAEGFRVVHTA